jgi:hypothetical protein
MSFRIEYQLDLLKDEEYEALLDLWCQYRRETEHLPAGPLGTEQAQKIEKRLFRGKTYDSTKYYKARIESMRVWRSRK